MAYGMQQLRKAGSYLADLDRKYADAIYAGREGNMSQIDINTQAIPLVDIPGNVATVIADDRRAAPPAYVVRGGAIGVDERLSKLPQMLQDTAYIAANAGVRYGLPAAGLTLAGKGLYDLTAMFGNSADYPEQGQLPL